MANNMKFGIKQDDYYITVIDHSKQAKAKLSIEDAINNLDGNLKGFDSVVMTEAMHDTLTGCAGYKPAKSTVVIAAVKSGVADKRTINYSDYSTLSCEFATPQFGTDLFIDKLDLTMPLTVKEAKKLRRVLIKDCKNHSRVKYSKSVNPMAAKYRSSFVINTKEAGKLILMMVPVSRQISRLKISYNPANCSVADVRVLVSKLKKVCGSKYRRRIINAKITRLDIAFDCDGYFVENTLFNLDKSAYYKAFIDKNGTIETKISGANRAKRMQFYDKTVAQCKGGNPNANPKRVNTRFEMTIRPHNIKGMGPVRLSNLRQPPALFTGLQVYDYEKLKKAIGEHTLDWEVVYYFGVAALKRTKNNTERTKFSRLLASCQVDIDEGAFNVLIQKRLKSVRQHFKW
ncbi:MAG: hypothetical protein HRT35_06140 [Algicola sp.]|nr:hypothetical protein [Algicola sp.]